ncbi:hypothetical protein [Noviherbaspirillum humi]|uniref:hypothetical protein n=1 Tax=Noviherbaspirillum humi TaxID=1688639 RepID=UPI000B77FE45|nr:hypothetical protein [Noviherbaspirillum humi]
MVAMFFSLEEAGAEGVESPAVDVCAVEADIAACVRKTPETSGRAPASGAASVSMNGRLVPAGIAAAMVRCKFSLAASVPMSSVAASPRLR